MVGKDWRVHTKEGWKKVGDAVIPLWVGTKLEEMGMHFGLGWQDVGEDELYLATVEVNYDPTLKTDKEFETTEFDFSERHPPGTQAMLLQGNEMRILAPGVLVGLQKAEPNEDHSLISLTDQNGNVEQMKM